MDSATVMSRQYSLLTSLGGAGEASDASRGMLVRREPVNFCLLRAATSARRQLVRSFQDWPADAVRVSSTRVDNDSNSDSSVPMDTTFSFEDMSELFNLSAGTLHGVLADVPAQKKQST